MRGSATKTAISGGVVFFSYLIYCFIFLLDGEAESYLQVCAQIIGESLIVSAVILSFCWWMDNSGTQRGEVYRSARLIAIALIFCFGRITYV